MVTGFALGLVLTVTVLAIGAAGFVAGFAAMVIREHELALAELRRTLKNYDALRASGGRADTLLLRSYADSDGTTGKILTLAITGSVSLDIPVRDIDMAAFLPHLLETMPAPDREWSYRPY